MTVLSADERTLLAAYAEAAESLDWWHVIEDLLPSKPRWVWSPRGRQRSAAWHARRDELVRAVVSLYKAELLREIPDGPADLTVVTEAGLEALWGPKPSGFIATDATPSAEQVAAWRRKWESERAPGGDDRDRS